MARSLALPAALPLLVAGALPAMASAAASYDNVTLTSPSTSVRVFLPLGLGESPTRKYYVGSRFEHGSMIGDVVLGGKEVYGRGMWRVPHDPSWPESGVGLASEFGCGDDGASCEGKGDITNGVLGYNEAKVGEPFLKIGVGALIKGSCPDCAGHNTYKFNSPYKFYRAPVWRVLPSPDPNEVTFLSEEKLGTYGYRLQKTVRLDGNVLTVRSLLTNIGKKRFTTPWYSHHFFTGDNAPVGPGYDLDLGLSEYALRTPSPVFEQPGFGSWAEDIADYANVTMARDGSISLHFFKELPPVEETGTRLKVDFLDDDDMVTITDGSFSMRAPNGVSVYEKIPELQTQSRNPFIYAYNVYAERGTLSPEPILLLYLEPGETTFWTQHLKFSCGERSARTEGYWSDIGNTLWPDSLWSKAGRAPLSVSQNFVFVVLAACLGTAIKSLAARFDGWRRRTEYSSVPDSPSQQELRGVSTAR